MYSLSLINLVKHAVKKWNRKALIDELSAVTSQAESKAVRLARVLYLPIRGLFLP